MLRLIRVRLALSYAGIALLVTLSLGAVLLVRLQAYYADLELNYLNSNAKAISVMAAPLLTDKYPKEVQDAQASNLAFLSQTRIRILDAQQRVVADSGPWQLPRLGLGVVAARKMAIDIGGETVSRPASVIVVEKRTVDSQVVGADATLAEPRPVEPGEKFLFRSGPSNSVSGAAPDEKQAVGGPAVPGGQISGSFAGDGSDVLFFNTSVPVTNGVYGYYLNGQPLVMGGARSAQAVQRVIRDESGARLGYVELSEGPAYGAEIVSSVASGLAVAGGLAILLAIAAGWWTSRRLTAPLLSLTQATEQMSSGDLSVRVAEAGRRDEFGVLGKSFNQMAGRIEETVQTLRRFLSDAAHELQTPLTALRTNLELARGEADSADREKYLSQAQAQIERLQRLIKDLLTLSHLESALSQPANASARETFQRLDLADLVRQASEPFAARAEQAGQSFELDLPSGEAWVQGSPEKLCSALGNLIDNALKFTPAGGAVTVRLKAGAAAREAAQGAEREPVAEAGAREWCLSVADTGIGIPPEEVGMLFNRFHRARNASAYPGSGLGLAIVKTIAQAHGGRVQAENNVEGGARFTLCLPGAESAEG